MRICTVIRLDGTWHFLIATRNHVGIKISRRIDFACSSFFALQSILARSIRNKCHRAFHVVIESLDGSARLAAEGSQVFRVTLGATRINVASLHRSEHRVLAIAEIVSFGKNRRAQRRTDTVLGVSIVVVVIHVGAVVTDSWMAAIGMVVPVVVISDIIAFGRTFGKTEQVRLAVIPEVVIAEGDIGGLLAVQRTVALHLVGIGTRIAIEEVVVVNPDILVVLLQTNIVALVAIHVHDAQVADFHILCVLDTDAPAIHHGIGTHALHRHVGIFGTAEIDHQVARFKNTRVSHITNQTDVKRSRFVTFLVASENTLYTHTRGLCAL